MKINIKGIGQPEVLRALYMHAKECLNDLRVVNDFPVYRHELCQLWVSQERKDFKKLFGVTLELSFEDPKAVDVTWYDNWYGGEGTAKRIVDGLRPKKAYLPQRTTSKHTLPQQSAPTQHLPQSTVAPEFSADEMSNSAFGRGSNLAKRK